MTIPTPSCLSATTLALLMLASPVKASAPWSEHGRLAVAADDPHYIRHADGTRFWWFGDTAWELIHRATRPEVELYLDDRQAKGFTVVQTVILSEMLRVKESNAYGAVALEAWDPLRPVLSASGDGFWDHVDFIIDAAARRGIYVGLLPTWGELVVPRNGPPVFQTASQAYGYGFFIGQRYASRPNIIWVLGGDRQPDERPEGVALWRAMAEGIADGVNNTPGLDGSADYASTFMTHHAYNSSSTWFHGDPWIDVHMWGSYHSEYDDTRSWELAEQDWNLAKPLPTLNAEPCYEEHPLNYAIPDNGWFTAVDVRVAAYWSVFSGAAGFTYGAHPIWQFSDATRPPYSGLTRSSWHTALAFPGATHVQHLQALLRSRPATNLRPARELIVAGGGQPAQRTVVLRGDSHLLAYMPTGNDLTLRLGALSGRELRAWWFDPRTGRSREIGTLPNAGEHTFAVPGMSEELTWLRSGRGCDWVLVLDDASAGFAQPGSVR